VIAPSNAAAIEEIEPLVPGDVPESQYEDISLAEWMTHTPHQLREQHLNVGWAMIDAIPNDETVIVQA
jgi:oxalate decarboxylase/phosphoglucose isomerase-like protein (cupin superfamily)